MKKALLLIASVVIAAVPLQLASGTQRQESLSEINAREFGLWPLEKLSINPSDIEIRIFYFGGLFTDSALVLKKNWNRIQRHVLCSSAACRI